MALRFDYKYKISPHPSPTEKMLAMTDLPFTQRLIEQHTLQGISVFSKGHKPDFKCKEFLKPNRNLTLNHLHASVEKN